MLKKIVESLKKLSNRGPAFDPSVLDDPVAMRTEWKPLKRGGANFKTHKLVEVNFHRFEFKATVFTKIFCIIFLLAGLAVFFFFGVNTIDMHNFSMNIESLLPLVFGLIFALIGALLLYFGTKPIVFDKTFGYYWKSRKEPAQTYDQSVKKTSAPLSNVHALQIISEYVSSSKSSYYSYELNLVLKDGSRLNVIDHGRLESIRSDAQKLSGFLGVPLWDSLR
jgi:hypothetical protein